MRRRLVLLALLGAAAAYDAVSEAAVLSEGSLTSDDFGQVVSVSGDLLLVGAPLEDLNGTDAGGAYVYVLSGGLWTLEARLVAHDVAPGDRFGSAVRLWQGYAVVGAAGHDTGGLADTGAAYIFWKSPLEGWLQQAQLLGSDTMAGDRFGVAVGITEGYAVVGADWHTGPGGTGCGAAYVFGLNGTWTQEAKLVATDGAAFDRFGGAVAVDLGRAIVGALDAEENGAAYIFERSDSGPEWREVAKYVAQSNSTDSDRFGSSVALSGDTAVVGAFWDDSEKVNGGAAYIYSRNATAWGEGSKIFAPDGAREEDRFGISVDVSGNSMIIGAYFDSRVTVWSGSAYIFAQLDAVNWSFQEKVTWSQAASAHFFGRGVGIWDSQYGPFTAVVGAPGANSTVVFEGGLPTTTTSSTVTSSSTSSSSVTVSSTTSSSSSSSVTSSTSKSSSSSVTSVTHTTTSGTSTSSTVSLTTSQTSTSSVTSSTSSTGTSSSSTRSVSTTTTGTSTSISRTSSSVTHTSFTSTSLTATSLTGTSSTSGTATATATTRSATTRSATGTATETRTSTTASLVAPSEDFPGIDFSSGSWTWEESFSSLAASYPAPLALILAWQLR